MPNSKLTDKLCDSIQNRRWYKFSWTTILRSVFCVSRLRCKKADSEPRRRDRIFDNGCSRIDFETDLVYL